MNEPRQQNWNTRLTRLRLTVVAIIVAVIAIAGHELIVSATRDLYDSIVIDNPSTPKGNVNGIYALTQGEYDALETKDPQSLYVITEE